MTTWAQFHQSIRDRRALGWIVCSVCGHLADNHQYETTCYVCPNRTCQAPRHLTRETA